MNRIITCLLLFHLAIITSKAQTFEKYIATDKDEVAHDAVEIDGLGYYILSQENAADYSIQDYIIKV